jgi:uncharacterized protein with von Willebrand factor type A (vWA) domain
MSAGPAAEAGLERLVGFGRLLRRRGLPVGTGRILVFCRAVAALGTVDRDALYWAGRVAMVASRQDVDVYDAAFRDWFPEPVNDMLAAVTEWLAHVQAPAGTELLVEEGFAEEALTLAGAEQQGEGQALVGVLASATEVLRTKSFEELTEVERLAANAVLAGRDETRGHHRPGDEVDYTLEMIVKADATTPRDVAAKLALAFHTLRAGYDPSVPYPTHAVVLVASALADTLCNHWAELREREKAALEDAARAGRDLDLRTAG